MLKTYKFFFAIPIILFILWLWNRRKYYYMEWKLNGPFGYPFIGVGLHFLNRKKILHYFERCHKKYGRCWFFFLGLEPCITVSDPAIIEEIYNSEKMLEKMNFYDPIRLSLGDGLFTSSNSKWMHNRKLMNKVFRHKSLISFFPIFNNQGRIVVNQIIEKYVGKGECDILDEFTTCTLCTTMKTTMGDEDNDFESVDNIWFLNSFKTAQNIVSERIFNPIFNLIFPLHPIKKQFDKIEKELLSYLNDAMKKRFQVLSERDKKRPNNEHETDNLKDNKINIKNESNIFIDQLYEFYKSGELTFEDVKAEILTMMAASFETTANTLYTTLFLLAMYPKYQDILYNEIMSICPDDDCDVTYEHIREMSYLEMVINETMRIISTVPLVGRKASADVTLKNGLFIAKGTNVVLDIFHLHRDVEIWGPNTKKFNPENFLKDNILRKHSYNYVPFTKGIRNCIGWRYGMYSLKILLIHIIKKYEIKTNWNLDDIIYIVYVTICYEKNPKLEFYYRN